MLSSQNGGAYKTNNVTFKDKKVPKLPPLKIGQEGGAQATPKRLFPST